MPSTAGYSTAASWLQHISGQNPKADISKKDESSDPILRDLRSMKDAETQDKMNSLPPPRQDLRNEGRARVQQQPKPKFVAHKDPTKGRKGKEKVVSNRLGNELHMA